MILLCGLFLLLASIPVEGLPCLPGVDRFASRSGLDFYYQCDRPGEEAIEVQCPHGQLFSRKGSRCIATTKSELTRASDPSSENGIRLEPVLGRSARLGDMYDARQDLVIRGNSLWNEYIVDESKQIEMKTYSNTLFFAENSEKERIDHFDISAHLELSFLGGLISVSGSANYLRDEKLTEKTLRFNLDYKATTRVESLPSSMRRNLTYGDVCASVQEQSSDGSGPTHIVASITYGMNAIMIFEKVVSESESQESVGGKLSIAVNSIPGFSISGEGEINMDESNREFYESITCKMYGDFILESSPSTFNDSIRAYKELPSHLGTEEDQYKKSSPVEFLLVPISEYCSDVDIMLAGISDGLMTLATEAMLSLNAVMLKIRTLEATYIANKFMDMQSILKLFDTELQIFTLSFKRQLQTILPAVRSGGGEEDLSLLLMNYTDSPFFYDTSYFFLSERETEINTINHLFEDVQGPNATADSHIMIGDSKSANIAEALLKKTFVVIYKFNVFTTKYA